MSLRRASLFAALIAGSFAAPACSSDATTTPDAAAPPPVSASVAASATATAPRERAKAPVREGGALARSPEGDALYLADEDHRALRRVPLPLDQNKLGLAMPMPGAPAQVLPLADRVLVTIRDPGLLLVLKPDPAAGMVEVARASLPADAWGVAVTADEATALVTSAWTHKLSAVDLASGKVKWTVDTPREPRGVVVRSDGVAYVTHLVGASITRVEGIGGTPQIKAIELPPAPARAPSGKTLNASLAYAAALNDDGTRLFVPRHAIGALGLGSWFGAMTVDVLATRADVPVLPKRLPGMPIARHPTLVQMVDASIVNNMDVAGADVQPVTQPRAILYRKGKKTLLVAGEGDDRVVEFDALSAAPALRPLITYKVAGKPDPHTYIPATCMGPTGLALSSDETKLWVWCRSTYDLAEVKLLDPDAPLKAPGEKREQSEVATVHVTDDTLDKEGALGRRFFHNATDSIVSGGLACSGCHPEGRDDGHVWHEAKVTSQNESERDIFIGEPELAPNAKGGVLGYARQTPMLAGRVAANGPYGWHAQNADLVERLKEGFGLHRWSSVYKKGVGEQLARIQYIRAFAQKGLILPPREGRPLTEQEKKGKDLFLSERARCGKCHAPETSYTDRVAYPFPKVAPPRGFEEDPKAEFKTPSLLFVGGTPPYFHDGRYRTLDEVIDQNNDKMGFTNWMSPEERAALIAFLRTL